MSVFVQSQSESSRPPSTAFEYLRIAQAVIQNEAVAMNALSEKIPLEFAEAVEMIAACQGAVIVTGIGKAGWIGQKISSSFASTGTRSHFLHPAEALHGDFGRIGEDDTVFILSNSGETGEVLQLLPTLEKLKVNKIAVTANGNSSLSRSCDLTIAYGAVAEACRLGLAPTTSTALMLAIGDALALTLSERNGFSNLDFAKFHPGGSLGRKLQTVQEAMRPLGSCRVANENSIARAAITSQSHQGRRTGAILVTDDAGRLTGIFTDSDLVKLLERNEDRRLDQPLRDLMCPQPKSICRGEFASVAVELLAEYSISELPVVDDDHRPLGILDITDLI